MTAVIVPPLTRTVPRADEPLYEIIDGIRVDLPPMSIQSSRVNSRLLYHLGVILRPKPPGEVLCETLLRLPLPVDRNRRPDLAFVSWERIALAPPQPGSDNAWDIVPELMVEVISPHDLAEEVLERLGEYWAAGARLIWVVYPMLKVVHVHESPTQIRVLCGQDELDGGTILPGLRLPLGTIFPA